MKSCHEGGRNGVPAPLERKRKYGQRWAEMKGRGQRASVMPGRVGQLVMGGVPKAPQGVKVSGQFPVAMGVRCRDGMVKAV